MIERTRGEGDSLKDSENIRPIDRPVVSQRVFLFYRWLNTDTGLASLAFGGEFNVAVFYGHLIGDFITIARLFDLRRSACDHF